MWSFAAGGRSLGRTLGHRSVRRTPRGAASWHSDTVVETRVNAPPRQRSRREAALSRLTPAERAARGKAARAQVPRDSHAVFERPANHAGPVSLLEQQAASRVPELVPV